MEIFGDLRSGNCLKVKTTAEALGLPFRWVDVDIMAGETHTPAFLAMNPVGQIPVMRLPDGKILAQSNAIIRYLARGSYLLPEDPFGQAKIDEWLFWEQYSHEPYIAVARFQMVYQGKTKEARDERIVTRGEAALDLMERHLRTQPWFANNTPSIADIALGAYTALAEEGGFDLTIRPHVRDWLDRSPAAFAPLKT